MVGPTWKGHNKKRGGHHGKVVEIELVLCCEWAMCGSSLWSNFNWNLQREKNNNNILLIKKRVKTIRTAKLMTCESNQIGFETSWVY